MGKKASKREKAGDRLTVTFHPQQRAALREIAARNGISESQVVCLIVDEFLARNAGKNIRVTLTTEDS